MNRIMYMQMNKIEEDHWWFSSKRKIVLDIVKKQKNSGKKFCDLGCGTGVVLKYVQQLGLFDYRCGYDYSNDARAFSKEKVDCPVSHLDLNEEIQWQERYDAIVALDILEHIENHEVAIRNIDNALSENGYVIITVPAYMFMWSQHDENCMHRRRYSLRSLRELIKQTDLSIDYISYYNTFLFPCMLVERLFCKIFTINKNSRVENSIPPPLINNILKGIFSSESFFLNRKMKFVYGGSVICVAKKK